MGLWSLFRRREEMRRAKAAAEQLYHAILAGAKIEIPQSLKLDDPAHQAVMVLRKEHPDIVMTMLQGKGLVLMRGDAAQAAVTNQGFRILNAHGYFPSHELPPEAFLATHERFMEQRTSGGAEEAKVSADVALAADKTDQAVSVLGG